MPRKRTPEEQREYMKGYRGRQKLEIGGTIAGSEQQGDVRVIKEVRLMEVSLVADTQANRDAGAGRVLGIREPMTDRERGLPRSNYHSDHGAPGGWKEVIVGIDPKLTTKILDRIAPPRKQR